MSDLIYSFDSSSLIHAWRRAYRPRNFPTFWKMMEELIDEKRLKISSEVYKELEKKDDDVFLWCKKHKEEMFVDIDDDVQDRVIEIMRLYPRIVDTKSGKSGGDPFVIAIASSGEDAMVVVTEENPGGNRIPQICSEEQIQCINLADLIEREGWIL